METKFQKSTSQVCYIEISPHPGVGEGRKGPMERHNIHFSILSDISMSGGISIVLRY